MRKRYLFMFLPVLLFLLAGTSYAWQGRMGGVGDPYGLLQDESDFLIHPAKVAKGEGIRFYGDYRFLYTGVLEWDYEWDQFTPAGVFTSTFSKEGEGEEQRHEVLLGSSFPLWLGRMGIFFQYSGKRGDYDADSLQFYPAAGYSYSYLDLQSDLDDFAFRLLYGLPVGGFNLGGEVQIAHRAEENKGLHADPYWLMTNETWAEIRSPGNLPPLMLPYDSQYWEALFKGSLEGKVGPLDLEFTLWAGFPFGGENHYEYADAELGLPWPEGDASAFDAKGDVTGWRIGGDVWLRYPLAGDLSLPFLVRVDYQVKTRDGDGPGQLAMDGKNISYESEEQSLGITAGGGLEKELANGATIAAGIYYSYLQGDSDFQITQYNTDGTWRSHDYSDSPASREHQVMLRLAGEFALSPVVTLRMGLAPFFGWLRQDFKQSYLATDPTSGTPYTEDFSTDGYHWGIGASVGGTITFKLITLEPFINGGWQQLHLKGGGDKTWDSTGVVQYLYEMSKDRNEWSIGGGFSVLFDVP